MVESINGNTKNVLANVKNAETLDSNMENLEKSTQNINDRFSLVEEEFRSNLNDIQKWSQDVVLAIEQMRKMISEKSDEVILKSIYILKFFSDNYVFQNFFSIKVFQNIF